MQICVRMLTGKEITLPAVRPSTSADEVKAMVHDQEGLLPAQIRLVFAGREMKGEESLSDHRVTEHATVHVVLRLQPGIQIFVQTITGKTLTLGVEQDEPVRRVKSMVEAKEGIPHHLQRLIHAGKEMRDTDSLVDHGVCHSSTVRMALGVAGGGGLDDAGGLLEIGNRCQHPGCGVCDFLPFTCKGCKQKFCLDHYKRADHTCTAAPPTPPPGAAWWSPDVVAPADGRKSKKKKAKCVECRKKQVIPMRCDDCGACVCPSHRFGPDHRCAERRVKKQLRASGVDPAKCVPVSQHQQHQEQRGPATSCAMEARDPEAEKRLHAALRRASVGGAGDHH